MSDQDDESARQVARRQRRTVGDRSARVARTLMKMSDATFAKLDLDDELRDDILKARNVPSQIARRRAERTLAGVLRRTDLRDVEQRIANVEATGAADPRLFHLAEQWRARLIEEGSKAAEEFTGGNVAPLPSLIHQARRERDTGKPPGAARALFRHVMEALKAQNQAVEADDGEDDSEEE